MSLDVLAVLVMIGFGFVGAILALGAIAGRAMRETDEAMKADQSASDMPTIEQVSGCLTRGANDPPAREYLEHLREPRP